MKLIYYILFGLIFVVCGFFVVVYATGYKIDISNRTVSQTGMISVQAESGTKILINDEERGQGKVTLRSIIPAAYTVKVEKTNYHTWEKTIEVSPGEAVILNDIVLFKTNPKIAEFDGNSQSFLKELPDTADLSSSTGEIYQNGAFVTRLQSDVSGVCWYPDRTYIAYTADNKLKLVAIDGSNTIELLDKKSTSPVLFINSGRSVIYDNDGKTYKADIR